MISETTLWLIVGGALVMVGFLTMISARKAHGSGEKPVEKPE